MCKVTNVTNLPPNDSAIDLVAICWNFCYDIPLKNNMLYFKKNGSELSTGISEEKKVFRSKKNITIGKNWKKFIDICLVFFWESQNTITSEWNKACFGRKMRNARPLAGFWRTLPYIDMRCTQPHRWVGIGCSTIFLPKAKNAERLKTKKCQTPKWINTDGYECLQTLNSKVNNDDKYFFIIKCYFLLKKQKIKMPNWCKKNFLISKWKISELIIINNDVI